LQRAAAIMENDGKAIEIDQLLSYSNSEIGANDHSPEISRVERTELHGKHMPEMMRVMEDIFVASEFWL